MVEEDNTLILDYAKEEQNIIRFLVKSRHINSKTYKCYVQYEPNENGINGIRRYCCNCANGNRTIGCCSHVAALVYYLSHGRFLCRMIKPSDHLTRFFDMNDIIPIIDEDSDED